MAPGKNREVAKELRYVERATLLTAIQAQSLVRTAGRIVRLLKKYDSRLPEEFLADFRNAWSILEEHQEAVKREMAKLERNR